MADLVVPHGGVSEPISCIVPKDEIAQFEAEASSLQGVPLSAADLSSAYRFADGTLSPLTGPMNRDVFDRVLDECVIDHGGILYAWTIPIALPVTSEVADTVSAGQTVSLIGPHNQVVGTLQVSDVYPWDKKRYLEGKICFYSSRFGATSCRISFYPRFRMAHF